jgi:hypothetical protein
MPFSPPNTGEKFYAFAAAIARLPLREQILALKRELFEAHKRELGIRFDCAELKEAIRTLRIKSAGGHQDGFADWLRVEFAQGSRELASFKRVREKNLRRLHNEVSRLRAHCEDQEKRLHHLHLELRATEVDGEELEQTCQSLLLMIERAAQSAGKGDSPEAQALGAGDSAGIQASGASA